MASYLRYRTENVKGSGQVLLQNLKFPLTYHFGVSGLYPNFANVQTEKGHELHLQVRW